MEVIFIFIILTFLVCVYNYALAVFRYKQLSRHIFGFANREQKRNNKKYKK